MVNLVKKAISMIYVFWALINETRHCNMVFFDFLSAQFDLLRVAFS